MFGKATKIDGSFTNHNVHLDASVNSNHHQNDMVEDISEAGAHSDADCTEISNDEEETAHLLHRDHLQTQISTHQRSIQKTSSMKKEIGLCGGVALIVGDIIGSGIFASPRSVMQNSGSVGASLIVWVACGVLSSVAALCYIELGTMIPKSGGEQPYLKEAFGPLLAFLFSFTTIIILRPAGMASVALATGNYMMEPFGNNEILWRKLIAVAVIVLVVTINCISVKLSTRVQIFFTGAKLIAIAMLVTTGIVRLVQGHTSSFHNAFNGTTHSVSNMGYAFYGGMFAFGGWQDLNYVTEEMKNPMRDLPLSILISMPIVTASYVLVNIAYLTVLTSAEIIKSSAVAVTMAHRIFGPVAWIVPVFVAFSTFGSANGVALCNGRIIYVSARDGHMPSLLATVHRKQLTPIPALVVNGFIACLMLIPRSSNFENLVNYFSFSIWIFCGMTFLALIWLRIKQPNRHRPFKVLLTTPIIALLCALYLVLSPFYDYPMESGFCLLSILAGVPFYFMLVKYHVLPDVIMSCFGTCAEKIQSCFGIVMPELEDEEE